MEDLIKEPSSYHLIMFFIQSNGQDRFFLTGRYSLLKKIQKLKCYSFFGFFLEVPPPTHFILSQMFSCLMHVHSCYTILHKLLNNIVIFLDSSIKSKSSCFHIKVFSLFNNPNENNLRQVLNKS